MELDNINTYDQLSDYLLDHIDYADSKISIVNKSFTRKEVWNIYMNDCLRYAGEDLPIRTKSIMIKRIKKDFGQKTGVY